MRNGRRAVVAVLVATVIVAGCSAAPQATESTPIGSAGPESSALPPGPESSALPPGPATTAATSTPSSGPATTAGTPAPPPGPPGTAAGALALLPVRDAAASLGYDRDQFGQKWSDDTDNALGHNGCDTRNDILKRDLTAVALKPRTNDCVVLAGVLDDPYTGESVPFLRGEQTSADVQIDHVVALAAGWRTGAQLLTPERRQDFANDPLELLAVKGQINQSKSDGDAASWLPPDRAFRCDYVARQIAVKTKYQLWVTQDEQQTMAAVLVGCPDQPLPTG